CVDRRAHPLLDDRVEADELPAESFRDDRAERRLAGTHEPYERQVAVEGVQRRHVSPIRARYDWCAASMSTSASPPNFSLAARASSQATAAPATTIPTPSPPPPAYTAWMPTTAAASRASSRSAFSAYEPSPGGTPVATTSTMPPSVSRSARAASVASRMPSSPVAPPISIARP